MRANLLMATMCGAAALAMNSVYGRSMAGILSWLGFQAPALMQRIAWRDLSCVAAAVHACNWLGTVVLMTLLLGLSRR
jgi:hypothetical protein